MIVIKVQLKSITFTSDHGVLTDKNDNWLDGGTVYSEPEWQPGTNNPITHKQNTKISETTKLIFEPTGVTYDLFGDGGEGHMTFVKEGLTSTAAEQSVSMTAEEALPDSIKKIEKSIEWKVVVEGYIFSIETTGSHKVYVLHGTPEGSAVTEKRVSWAVGFCEGKKDGPEIANKLGPDVTAYARFGSKSIFGRSPSLTTAWQVMGGEKADCGTLSTLMKYSMQILGVTGAEVKYVYSRHNSWSGLVSNSPSWGAMEKRISGNNSTRLGFIAGNWNNYEGCCVYDGKWWMGGAGSSKPNAYEVLMHWTQPNNSATNNRQVYFDQQNVPVAYPAGTP